LVKQEAQVTIMDIPLYNENSGKIQKDVSDKDFRGFSETP
jgi:hypothetical protein